MMLRVGMLLRFYVVTEPIIVLAGGTANFIIYFDYFIVVTDVLSLGQMLLSPFYLLVIIVHHVTKP